MPPSLTQPEQGVEINDFANIMKCKMHAHLAFGTMGDSEIPSDATELAALLSGAGQKFVPLGDLAKDPIEYGWKRDTEEVHAGKLRGVLNIEGMIKGINISTDMIDLMDLPSMKEDCTVMFLPFGNPATADVSLTNPAFAVIVRGVSIVSNGKGNGNNKYGEVTLEFNAQPDKIGDALLLLKITDDGIA